MAVAALREECLALCKTRASLDWDKRVIIPLPTQAVHFTEIVPKGLDRWREFGLLPQLIIAFWGSWKLMHLEAEVAQQCKVSFLFLGV